MLFLLQNHGGEYRVGAYFLKYPSLPISEAGRIFRFKEEESAGSEQSAVANLEYGARRKTIVTTSDLSWKEKAYVLIESTLWRIETWSSEDLGACAVSPIKVRQKRFRLELTGVDNVSEVSL